MGTTGRAILAPPPPPVLRMSSAAPALPFGVAVKLEAVSP
jgi:hypothetical protein